MTPEEHIDGLLKAGASIQVHPPGMAMLTFVLGGVLHLPGRLRWTGIFPEHQSHVHEVYYDRTKIEHERDVGLWKGDKRVAYVAPLQESGLELDIAMDELAEWQHQLAEPGQAARLVQFMEEAI